MGIERRLELQKKLNVKHNRKFYALQYGYKYSK